jgi:hypothetical protein
MVVKIDPEAPATGCVLKMRLLGTPVMPKALLVTEGVLEVPLTVTDIELVAVRVTLPA